MARKYGDLTRQVKQMAIVFIQTNGEFPKVSDVLATLPHLATRRHGVEKAVQTLRARWTDGELTADIDMKATPRPEFDRTWEGMLERLHWYMDQLDGIVERTKGSSVPIKELSELTRLIREVQKWKKEDEGARGEVAHARPAMTTIIRRAAEIEKHARKGA